MKKLFFHVGFRKTATTYLQKHFFPCLDNKDYHFVTKKDTIFDIVNSILRCQNKDIPIEEIIEKANKALEEISETNVIISMESLVGEAKKDFYDHIYIRDMLKKIFGDVNIIITIRKQSDMIRSQYIQTIHIGGSHTFDEFSNYCNGEFREYNYLNKDIPNVDVKKYDYYWFYKSYLNICDKENILVLPYELLIEDRENFFIKLCDFLGLDCNKYEDIVNAKNKFENRSYSALSLSIARLLNKFSFNKNVRTNIRKILNKTFDKVFYVKAKILKEEQSNKIMDIHKDGNKKISDVLNLDLDKLHYY